MRRNNDSLNYQATNYQATIDRFRRARSDPSLVVLEGFHVLKHALRFAAAVLETVTADPEQLVRLTDSLSPDLSGVLGKDAVVVPPQVFRQLSPVPPSTGVIAIAQRPHLYLPKMFNDLMPAPLVLLENPRSHGNIGAAIRVAAAAGAAGVITTGEHDPWHPSALVGSAGLHFALPVARADTLSLENKSERSRFRGGRTLVAVDPGGEPLRPGLIPERAALAFGSERDGASAELLAAADCCIAIPMEPGVSSLNLATAVAVVLYAWRLA